MKFSARLPHDIRPNALTELLRIKRQTGARILDLTESNPTHAGIEYPAGFLNSLASEAALRYEPEPFGLLSAREAIAPEYGAEVERVGTGDLGRGPGTASVDRAEIRAMGPADPGDVARDDARTAKAFSRMRDLDSKRRLTGHSYGDEKQSQQTHAELSQKSARRHEAPGRCEV